MKMGKIFWGILFILAAALLILDALGVTAPLIGTFGKVSVPAIIVGIILIAIIINRLIRRKIGSIFFPLAFLFMIFEKNIAHFFSLKSENIINNALVLLIALLLTIGAGLIFGGMGTRTRIVEGVHIKGKNAGGSLGHSSVYIDSETLCPNYVENNLGSCTVYFESPEKYLGGSTLKIANNLGAMTVHVPSFWKIVVSVENNLGGLSVPKNTDNEGPVLYIRGENNLGSISIKKI